MVAGRPFLPFLDGMYNVCAVKKCYSLFLPHYCHEQDTLMDLKRMLFHLHMRHKEGLNLLGLPPGGGRGFSCTSHSTA
jgi:hypothetical protein